MRIEQSVLHRIAHAVVLMICSINMFPNKISMIKGLILTFVGNMKQNSYMLCWYI